MHLLKFIPLGVVLLGCASLSSNSSVPFPAAAQVDLPRYMGTWYLIASIPLDAEKNGYNITESYALNANGSVAVRFRKREGGFEGELKTREFTGFVRENTGNAVWGMRVIWPIKADYRIAHITPDYSVALIGRQKRDHAWILARRPDMSDADYQRYRNMFTRLGYDIGKFQRFPQRWPERG